MALKYGPSFFHAVKTSTTTLPALADSQKIGFFSLDRSSQTEITEIVDIKELTEVIQVLLQDVSTIRRDINLNKHVMQADYEVKLQNKSLELYRRINERVSELEKLHQERVSTLRHAFRQQLSDAISRLSFMFEQTIEIRLAAERKKYEGVSNLKGEKYRELQTTIKRQEDFIQMLQIQIDQYRQRISEGMPADRSGMDKRHEEAVSVISEDTHSHSTAKSMDDDDRECADKLNEELSQLQQKIALMEEGLSTKEEEADQLKEQIDTLQIQLKRCRGLVDQLHHDKFEIKSEEVNESLSARKALEKMRTEWLQTTAEQVKLAKEEAYNKGMRDARAKMRKESLFERSDSRKGGSPDILDSTNKRLSKSVTDATGHMRSPDNKEVSVRFTESQQRTGSPMGRVDKTLLNGVDKMQRDGVDRTLRDGVDKTLRDGVDKTLRGDGVDKMLRDGVDKTLRDGVDKTLRDGVDSRSPVDTERIKQLIEQNMQLAELLEKEKAKNYAKVDKKNKEEASTLKHDLREQALQTEIAKLKRETEKINRIWEKKFAILQRSLFALKDESYLRHTLQKQAATLHHAAVSYAADKPIEIKPVKQSSIAKKPLPEIPKSVTVVKSAKGSRGAGPGGAADKDFISYTVSVPSGRGSAVFSVDENQVLSDTEQELPVDVAPLPPPPARNEPSEEVSQPSANARVIVVPSADVS
ncbi:cingulin-like isoform X2 [Gigantopelta aegis]|uniref:cingulin-like isoform X2 n=1 Tax=Gigantopelta aegis TaxID=1735272 RepID=UPI001B8896BA|nr:cingulin-like isoform X2 [Gigantopelta aegis]